MTFKISDTVPETARNLTPDERINALVAVSGQNGMTLGVLRNRMRKMNSSDFRSTVENMVNNGAMDAESVEGSPGRKTIRFTIRRIARHTTQETPQ